MTEETVPTTVSGPAGEPAPPAVRPAWGPWVTTGLLFLILVGLLMAQLAVGMIWLFTFTFHQSSPSGNLATLQYDGDLVAVTTVAGAAAAIGLAALLVPYHRGAKLREYLALKPVHWKTALLWVGGTLAFLVSYDVLSTALERPPTPDFMLQVYNSATLVPLLWIALVLAAPLWEEIVFRGFAFPGLRSARFGLAAAILAPNVFWAALHLAQYDAFDMTYVFLLGVLFAFARERTGSVAMPIILHVLTNALATIQVAFR
ncbi:MAG TPA: CPBP family intramembrane glutamic endopeptidase [Thermoanaerobaculia bacterium]